jgi:hypothetical protein
MVGQLTIEGYFMKTSKLTMAVMIVSIIVIALMALVAMGDGALNLNQYKWKNRLLFVFAPHNSHAVLIDLKNDLLARKDEILDRDLIIFEIFENGPSYIGKNRIDNHMAEHIRQKFDPGSGQLTVVLVGKDGGVKMRRNGPVQLDEIFSLIDAMPMRREEMRQKRQ